MFYPVRESFWDLTLKHVTIKWKQYAYRALINSSEFNESSVSCHWWNSYAYIHIFTQNNYKIQFIYLIIVYEKM